MSISKRDEDRLAETSILVVGVGGLGCPAALSLMNAGVGRLVLADDDLVDVTNLHRQTLFSEDDVSRSKLEAAELALRRRGSGRTRIETVHSRLLPDNARELVKSVDIVVEGADNFATKFLAADACRLERRPVVHGSAVRWRATAWAVAAEGKPCYRCLFEDLPSGDAPPNCAEAGVMGAVVGLAGALMADLALRLAVSDSTTTGRIHTYDGLSDRLRAADVDPRHDCPLCGTHRSIFDIDETRYDSASCAA